MVCEFTVSYELSLRFYYRDFQNAFRICINLDKFDKFNGIGYLECVSATLSYCILGVYYTENGKLYAVFG